MILNLDDWQIEALEHKGDLLLCTGRRIGKTYIMAKKAVDRMRYKTNTQIVVVSLTADQAELIIEFAREIIQAECPREISKKHTDTNKTKITFKNKSKLMARPVGNTGDAVRGFTGDVLIVDEASRMPPLMWMAAKPILLMTGGEIWMCSTPAGKEGYFWKQYDKAYNKKDPEARFKVIYKTSEDVVYNRPLSSTWTESQRAGAIRNLEEEKKDMSELEYGQEYLGLFMEDLKRLFDEKWITNCAVLEKSQSQASQLGTYFMGCDIARLGKDAGTFEIFKKTENLILHLDNFVTRKKLTTETHDNIIRLNKLWNFKKIGIDAGSGALGVGVLDWLLRSEVKRKVIALNNQQVALDREGKKKRALLKEDGYMLVLSLGERGILKLLKSDDVINSLRSVQYEIVREKGAQARFRVFSSPHSESHIMEGVWRGVYLANSKNINTNISYF